MKKYTLSGSKRTVSGRKVKTIRSQGQIPATIYGKKIQSVSISILRDAFIKVYDQAGETGLIELQLEKDTRPVLVHTVQVHPVNDEILHVEFHQVDLKEKVHAKVSVEHTGECPAVAQKLGVLLNVLTEIEVEALPTDLPEKIIVDVSKLTDVNQELKVADISVASGVTILTDKTLTIIKIGPLVTKEAEALAQAEAEAAAAAAAAAAPAEGTTTAAPTEGAPAAEATPTQETPVKPTEEKKQSPKA